jgi:hypothetical protein
MTKLCRYRSTLLASPKIYFEAFWSKQITVPYLFCLFVCLFVSGSQYHTHFLAQIGDIKVWTGFFAVNERKGQQSMQSNNERIWNIPLFGFLHLVNFFIRFLTTGVGIAQRYSAGLPAGWSGFHVPTGARNFSLHHRVQTGPGAHSASYPMGRRGPFPGGKAAGAWSWPLTSI